MYSQQSLAEERLLYPWPRPEGSYKIKSVCPSFRLPVSFLGIVLLVFYETYHNARSPYIVVCDSWIFPKKNPLGKNGQKWPKNMVLRLFQKITSLVLSGICVSQSSYDSLASCKNCMLGKNLVLKLKTKMALSQ